MLPAQQEVASLPLSYFDKFIQKMMSARLTKMDDKKSPLVYVSITLDEVDKITGRAIQSFMEQRSLIRIHEALLPMIIVGDLHGQYRELRNIFKRCGDSINQSYLFLGHYVDRGVQGVETVLLLMALKVRYPDRVYLLRGNHEDVNTACVYGFYDECLAKFAPNGEAAWTHFVSAFNWIPLCAFIGEKILCMHGGISPYISSLEAIENLPRPSIIPPEGLMYDLVWSDPVNKSFCEKMSVDLIVTAHQMNKEIKGGYKFFADCHLVSKFSAPFYGNGGNKDVILKSGPDSGSFLIVKPRPSDIPLR